MQGTHKSKYCGQNGLKNREQTDINTVDKKV